MCQIKFLVFILKMHLMALILRNNYFNISKIYFKNLMLYKERTVLNSNLAANPRKNSSH